MTERRKPKSTALKWLDSGRLMLCFGTYLKSRFKFCLKNLQRLLRLKINNII